MIRRTKNKEKNPYKEDDSSIISPAWKDYPPADVDKDPYELYLLKIERDSANNDIVEYFEAYTEYLANRRHDKARKYAKLHQEAIDKRDKLQEKIEKFSKSKNPRCRTFQVKRKVGKKTIQVRRKICNPENKRTQLGKLLGTEVIVHDGGKNPIKGILRSNSKVFAVYNSVGRGVGFGSSEIKKIKGSNIYLEKLF